MTIGRSNSEASETRESVSWKVERGPNSGRNCFGRTSREAGHSRVPAPPHMISGIIRLSIEPRMCWSNLVVAAIPRHKTADSLFYRGLRHKAGVVHQIADIGKGLHDVSR